MPCSARPLHRSTPIRSPRRQTLDRFAGFDGAGFAGDRLRREAISSGVAAGVHIASSGSGIGCGVGSQCLAQCLFLGMVE